MRDPDSEADETDENWDWREASEAREDDSRLIDERPPHWEDTSW